jgi:ABC-type branched-subunit amino acid transport system substrate-binding protein
VETWSATAFVVEGLSSKGKDFDKRYQEEFHEPPSLEAAQAYDSGRLLFSQMQIGSVSSTRTREDMLRELMEKLKRVDSFDSVTGKITWKDRQPTRTIFVVQVKNEEAKLVQTVAPDEK